LISKKKSIVMNEDDGYQLSPKDLPDVKDERQRRKERLAGSLRIFGRFGFDEGVAGHITVRDPELSDHFWVNPMGRAFKLMKVSDLLLVDHSGTVVEGSGLLNGAAFTIHSQIHLARPDVNAAAHAHSIHGKAWSSLGRFLDPLTQDSCAFYKDHVLLDEFTGVVLDENEGQKITRLLADKKAMILRNHGLLTVGKTVDAACWWFISMERACQAQLLAEAVGNPISIDAKHALETHKVVGSHLAGWFSFQPLFDVLLAEEPDFLD